MYMYEREEREEAKESIHHVSSSTKEEGSLCVLSSKITVKPG